MAAIDSNALVCNTGQCASHFGERGKCTWEIKRIAFGECLRFCIYFLSTCLLIKMQKNNWTRAKQQCITSQRRYSRMKRRRCKRVRKRGGGGGRCILHVISPDNSLRTSLSLRRPASGSESHWDGRMFLWYQECFFFFLPPFLSN